LATEEVISTREAAKMLGVSVRSVQLWVESGVLKAWKTAGNHRRIYLDSVNSLINHRDTVNPLILIVEDDETVQAYYKALFEELLSKPNLLFAENGFDGLLKLGECKPALLMADIDMPNMDGIEMVRSIHSLENYTNLPTVFVTALTKKQIAKRGPLPKNIKCYSKPLDINSAREIFSNAKIQINVEV